jgi:hypothetical protein
MNNGTQRRDKTMNLTKEQAQKTVDSMRMNESAKTALMAQWLSGDRGAKFVVINKYKQQRAKPK